MPRAAPVVSVLVPSHDGAWCIERTLRSVQRQTFEAFEAIVVDDGSSDGVAEVARACVGDDPRFRVLSQPNGGVAVARNHALGLAGADYVAPLDHDDLWEPEFLERTVGALQGAPHAVMAFTRSIFIDAHDRAPPQALADIPGHVDYRELLRRNPIGNGSCMVARREALQRVGFDEALVARFGQADDWWTQLQLSWLGAVVFVDAPLVRYRITSHGASNTQIRRITGATKEVIRRARTEGPPLATRDYLAARSLALLWQARRAKAAGERRLALELGLQCYLGHPLWFLEPELRAPILRRLTAKPAAPSLWRELLH